MVWNDERGRTAGIFEKSIRESKWQRMAKFRLGNGIRGGGSIGKRRFRVCGIREKTWQHIWQECVGKGEGSRRGRKKVG